MMHKQTRHLFLHTSVGLRDIAVIRFGVELFLVSRFEVLSDVVDSVLLGCYAVLNGKSLPCLNDY
jgi:hypothetical protein